MRTLGWNYTLESGRHLRKALDEEPNIETVRKAATALQTCYKELTSKYKLVASGSDMVDIFLDILDNDDEVDRLRLLEMYWYFDEDDGFPEANVLNSLLDTFWDVCDDIRAFVAL